MTGRGRIFAGLVDALGRSAAEQLVADFGGIRLYIPVAAVADGAIGKSVGVEAAEALSRALGGEYLDVPKATVTPAARAAEIVRLAAQGVSPNAIARAVDCTIRRVQQVLRASGLEGQRSAPTAAPPRPKF